MYSLTVSIPFRSSTVVKHNFATSLMTGPQLSTQGQQTNVFVLDFAKAFDTVLHERLKLKLFSVRKNLLFIYLAFSLSGEGHCYRFPQLQQALLYRFVVEVVTVHNTGISLLLSTSVWVLLSPPIERRETRPTV